MEPNYQHDPSEFIKKFFNAEKKFIEEETSNEIKEVVSESPAPLQATPSVTTKKTNTQEESLRVSTKKIDGLLNLIGELSIQQSILENSLVGKTHHENESLIFSTINLSRKITKEIYSMAFGLRMTPVGGVFQRLERAIKDLARDINKEVDVVLQGVDVEIEKTILDKLIDPLTHIVRNSIDHGLETKDGRKAATKDPKGQIVITAVKQDDGVEITIKDDGKGLDQKRILEKAIEKNLVKPSQNLTKEEIFSLIFLPGFSTAEKVTNISGRGVGMDVVMKTIEEINGKILVGSEEGRGSKFKIIVPTSMSIVDSLIVSINQDQYVLPINVLEEVIDVNAHELQKNDSIYVYRGQVIPFLHLRDVFGKADPVKNSVIPILVTKVQGKRLAIGVDQILGQHQSVVRNLSHYFEHSFAISGGTILPSGEPGLILNIPSIMNRYFKYLKSVTEVSA
jgi:two-component system chemotaxis sensor kinase CheA